MSNASWQERLAAGDTSLKIHLLGIGGAGLGPIATVLQEMGYRVSGSDAAANERTQALAAAGVRVHPRQEAANLTGLSPEERPDVVLASSAVGPDNPERKAAAALNIPVVKRQAFLTPLLARRKVIAVAGTHGKSTTTGMIVKILRENGVPAGYIIGSDLPGFGMAQAGTSPWFVIEADEYDHMFLGLQPHVAVVTNVEWDHPDCYPTPSSFLRAFMQFVDRTAREGLIVSCRDDAGAEALRMYRATRGAWITYGLSPDADIQARDVEVGPDGGFQADVCWWDAPLGRLHLATPGVHNLLNGLAALAVARYCDVDATQALRSLADYPGVARRFEIKGEAGGVLVIDDYAHHPTEVRATLAAARARYPGRRIWAVFQPHTFSRTRSLLQEMADSFGDADRVIVTDIYAARERDDGSVDAAALVAASSHPAIHHIADLADVAAYLAGAVQPGDVVITLGAGTSYRIGEMVLERRGDGVTR